MPHALIQYLRTARWENPKYAWWQLALAGLMLPLIALGFFFYDGWHRVSYMAAFSLIAVANVCLALGSLLPEERGGRLARQVATPLALLMMLALGVALGFQLALW